jgi:hypothetical protein
LVLGEIEEQPFFHIGSQVHIIQEQQVDAHPVGPVHGLDFLQRIRRLDIDRADAAVFPGFKGWEDFFSHDFPLVFTQGGGNAERLS